jgi:hypothetical protein
MVERCRRRPLTHTDRSLKSSCLLPRCAIAESPTSALHDVRLRSKADISQCNRHDRSTPEREHRTRPLSCRSTALRSGPAVDHNVRIEPRRVENGPQGWTPYGPLLPQQILMVERPAFFVNTPYRISSVGRWCNTKVPSDVETRPHHSRNMSVARLISVIQFTFDPRLSQPLDYLDSYAPSIKVSLLWRLSIVGGHRMANNTKWHSEKAPPHVTGSSRNDS